MSYGLLAVVFLVVLGVTLAAATMVERPYAHVDRRITKVLRSTRQPSKVADILAEIEPGREEESGAPAGKLRKRSPLGRVSDRMAGRRLGGRLAVRLRRADLKLQVAEFVLLSAGAGAFGLLTGWVANRAVLSITLGLGGIAGPFLYLTMRLGRRRKALDAQLADSLTLVSNSLRSGYSFLQAMDVVAKEMPMPISREFEFVLRETRVNIPVETALENLAQRVQSDHLDLAITAILTQRQIGGNLSEVLDNITSTIRERARLAAEIGTLTASGRLSGWVVAGIPIALVFLVSAINPEFMRPLYTHPMGWAAMGVALVMQILGLFVISRIVNVKF
ncbi:MAG: type II secretion system F family protein [Bacillota bacterium]|nr:type II secretion system F family protein [Bacillota bacterium]